VPSAELECQIQITCITTLGTSTLGLDFRHKAQH